ncbi:FAD-dependent tricarballylate dehydrogenase TcuA [Solirubrobacter taibaiensis]|nr:FAD-dependent tricarballylate dehydrogenase TcuA [Solirubrobacter taibaiensis]
MDAADVIVVGAGNAGMSAAFAARERGASVLVLEKAAREWAGGNSAFTAGAMRLEHGGLADLLDLVEGDERHAVTDLPPYTEFAADLERVTLGRGDPDMARVLVGDSAAALRWLKGRGVRFRLMYERQAYERDGRWTFWGGLAVGVVDGGRGLVDQQAAAARRFGIEVRHESPVEGLVPGGVLVRLPNGGFQELRARSIVLAAGGFESNPALRAGYLGPNWDVAKVRGTPFNTGEVLLEALEIGAAPYGNWSGCHAIQWDAGAPPTGDLELTNRFSRQSYPVGIVVNSRGERFIDEGKDFRNYTYAEYGAEVLRQPNGVAFQIFDQRSVPLLRGIDYDAPGSTRVEAGSLRELGEALRIDAERLERTVSDFNAAIVGGPFDPAVKDGLRAEGLAVPKSNWALALDTPPYVAFPVTCGITFTFGGLRVDGDARVLDLSGRPIPWLFACGELVGGLFFHNYPGGSGLTAGTVYGRRAGYAATA